MAETLGSLCDKLTVLKLKQWHSRDSEQLKNITLQEKLLQDEINEYINLAIAGLIPPKCIALPANKVYQRKSNQINEFHGSFGEVFSQLAGVNCRLWHQQEKIYEFEKVPPDEKDEVIKQLAVLNLERNQCIDEINANFQSLIRNIHPNPEKQRERG
jgi:hypothetical protein